MCAYDFFFWRKACVLQWLATVEKKSGESRLASRGFRSIIALRVLVSREDGLGRPTARFSLADLLAVLRCNHNR